MTTHQNVKINAKNRKCSRYGKPCQHNHTTICYGCGVHSGNPNKPVLFATRD